MNFVILGDSHSVCFDENRVVLLLPIFPIVKDEYIKEQPRIERRNISASYEKD
jgi:hypothetical protein